MNVAECRDSGSAARTEAVGAVENALGAGDDVGGQRVDDLRVVQQGGARAQREHLRCSAEVTTSGESG